MTTIAIIGENAGTDAAVYRAVAGKRQSQGKTAGEAIDAMTAQLNGEEVGTLVIVQNLLPDRFFSAAQQQRLTELMAQWRTARDTGKAFPADLQTELNALIAAELQAAAQRAAAIRQELGK
jgi:hypothetical protein